MCKFKTSIPSHHMAWLPTIRHPMLHTLPMRMSTALHPYPLRANNPYCLLFQALSLIPISHYLLFSSFVFLSFLYRFLELHFLQDLFSLFSGSSVTLTYHPASQFYDAVVSKCRILHGTYLATPWLSSPHLQTVFLNFFGRPPFFKYRRSLINNLTFLDSIVLPTDSRYVVCVIVVGLFDSSNDCACGMFLFQTTVYYS